MDFVWLNEQSDQKHNKLFSSSVKLQRSGIDLLGSKIIKDKNMSILIIICVRIIKTRLLEIRSYN